MILGRLFAARSAVTAGRALFRSAAAQARQPAFYLDGGIPDTVEGRFELYALHVILLLHRIAPDGDQAVETRQALFDAFLRDLDDALREMGVGDLSVGKKMRKLGSAIFGRVKSYGEALAAGADPAMLEDLVARTALQGGEPSSAAAMAAYIREAAADLATQPCEQFLSGEATWPLFHP